MVANLMVKGDAIRIRARSALAEADAQGRAISRTPANPQMTPPTIRAVGRS